MTLIRWNPTRDITPWPSGMMGFQREMNRMFDNFFRGSQESEDAALTAWTPAVDIAESDNEYVVRVELPGVAKEDVKITLESNVLTIGGEKKTESETKKEEYHRIERSYGSFQRSFTLPSHVRSEKIEASFKDGILTVVLPKAEESKPKQIEVKVR